MFAQTPLPPPELLFNLGLYVRGSLLAKFLAMNEVYERIRNLPGALVEFGVWWGQNLVLLENLRAIHEPFNKQRIIVGFDTFNGYTGLTERDRPAEGIGDRTYATGLEYRRYLARLLEVQEGSNAFGHVRGNHQLIEGDATQTAPEYFERHPETLVALAYFDIGIYEPTKAALIAIKPHLLPGSVIVFDELTWPGAPAEALLFKEVLANWQYTIEKSRFYPSRAMVTIRQAPS